MIVQLINDDGPGSVLLRPFVEELLKCTWITELRIVIPRHDKSWIGSALSRKGSVSVTKQVICGIEAHLIDGTPGDCANLGVHCLYSHPPDLVISGPNLGQNAGEPFTIASGTLNGAFISMISGCPAAIAVSAELTPEIWEVLLKKLDDPELDKWSKRWKEITTISKLQIERSLNAGLHKLGGVVNINLPWGVSLDTEVVLTQVQPGRLKAFFELNSNGDYQHAFHFPDFYGQDSGQALDHETVVQKKISLSILKPMHEAVKFSKADEAELFKRFK